jgi:hypothetical protein
MSELALLTLVGLAIVSLWMILVGAIQWRTARPIQKRAGFGRGPAEVRWLGLAEVLGGIAVLLQLPWQLDVLAPTYAPAALNPLAGWPFNAIPILVGTGLGAAAYVALYRARPHHESKHDLSR